MRNLVVKPGARLVWAMVLALIFVAVDLPDTPGGTAQAKKKDRAPQAVESDALTELLIKFEVTGTFESFDPITRVATFTFSGPFFESVVGPGGVISDRPGEQLGHVVNARVQFTLGATSDTFRFTCDECEFRFFDGSVMQPLLSIPMEGRMLVELGPVPPPDPSLVNLRGAGCGGAQETAGRGKLANLSGALCVNGVFGFPASVLSLQDPSALVGLAGVGESDCTLVFHKPLLVL